MRKQFAQSPLLRPPELGLGVSTHALRLVRPFDGGPMIPRGDVTEDQGQDASDHKHEKRHLRHGVDHEPRVLGLAPPCQLVARKRQDAQPCIDQAPFAVLVEEHKQTLPIAETQHIVWSLPCNDQQQQLDEWPRDAHDPDAKGDQVRLRHKRIDRYDHHRERQGGADGQGVPVRMKDEIDGRCQANIGVHKENYGCEADAGKQHLRAPRDHGVLRQNAVRLAVLQKQARRRVLPRREASLPEGCPSSKHEAADQRAKSCEQQPVRSNVARP
mmetsp:Transcript_65423/g.200371  ORF Transcript_65423/g.200371 Transcript_65423/m.200371 type:complete len:271 (+) Transcript_65423:984-1796(+)